MILQESAAHSCHSEEQTGQVLCWLQRPGDWNVDNQKLVQEMADKVSDATINNRVLMLFGKFTREGSDVP